MGFNSEFKGLIVFVGHCTKQSKLTSVIFVCRVLCAVGSDWYILPRAPPLLKGVLDNTRQYIRVQNTQRVAELQRHCGQPHSL